MHEPSNGNRGDGAAARQHAGTRARYLLLALPLIGTLIPSIYNRHDPTLIGIPFFYWYLLLWVPITVVLLAIVSRSAVEDG
ncbi:MAG: hypothetical protein QOH74_883 [Gaiellales bacterium]|jgi:hypothetical protein|nr:hypothetical protein [Gaiellales bacterium]